MSYPSYPPAPNPYGPPQRGQQGGAPAWGTGTSSSSHAAAGLESARDGTVSTIQIRVSEGYRVQPGVPLPSALMPSGSSAGGPIDLSLERTLVSSASGSHVQTFFDSVEPSSLMDKDVATHTGMGFSRAQASLGLVYARKVGRKDEEAIDFANHYQELGSMGYGAALSAGALLLSEDKLPEATEACLNAS
ncbi:hypothetical protein FOA52_001085 [Chlamydomonas sp. UWO 241]|nr:hypothetical protein FOA52_001085 [Chlamydomonas sp. UWO 241]